MYLPKRLDLLKLFSLYLLVWWNRFWVASSVSGVTSAFTNVQTDEQIKKIEGIR